MIEFQYRGGFGAGNIYPAFPGNACFLKGAGKVVLAENDYELPSPSSAPLLREPRKTYRTLRKRRSTDTSGNAYRQDIFTRLDRLRENAGKSSVREQLERLQAIAALMQQRDQGPMPGELLRIYAWEIEDTADKLERLMKQE